MAIEVERVGLSESRQSPKSNAQNTDIALRVDPHLKRDPVEIVVERRARDDAQREAGTVIALSRGPPGPAQEGKEAPFPLHHPESPAQTQYPPATTIQPILSNAGCDESL